MHLMHIVFFGIMMTWIVIAVFFVEWKKASGLKLVVQLASSAFLIVGGLGFFGAAIASTGGLNWLPISLEWPLTHSSNAVRLDSGEYVVPHEGAGRVQVYDENLEFIRGWSAKSDGGSFVLVSSTENQFFVVTARGNRRDKYDALGTWVSASTYSGDYPPAGVANVYVELEVNPLLWPFMHPFVAWLYAAIGMVLGGLAEKMQSKKDKTVP